MFSILAKTELRAETKSDKVVQQENDFRVTSKCYKKNFLHKCFFDYFKWKSFPTTFSMAKKGLRVFARAIQMVWMILQFVKVIGLQLQESMRPIPIKKLGGKMGSP